MPERQRSYREVVAPGPTDRGARSRVHASDSLYAWAWHWWSSGGAVALAEDQGPVGLQATHGGGTGGGLGRRTAAPVDDRG